MTTRVSRNVPRLGTEDSSKEHVIGKKGKKPNVQKWSICRARFLLGATLKKMERNLRKHIIQHYLFLRDRFPKMALKQLITCPLVNKTFRRFEKKYCIHLGYHWVHHGGEDRPGFRWASNLPYSGAGPDSSGRRFNGKRGNRRGNRKASRGEYIF
ncbi:uncharacterized protein LOC136088673 isoform X2 [Hydra vulgaris]|uniref:Uncharacterized protein LOC136088673 isoform X2 n=1 Tax=Hydra vulgaris TaxID=6087 RepID=A0ABM4D466_HYDVU